MLSSTTAQTLRQLLADNDIPEPAALTRALEIQTLSVQPPPQAVLDMDDEAILTLALTTATYTHPHDLYREQLVRIADQAFLEATAIIHDSLDDIVAELRPAFNEAAAVLQAAIAEGITSTTTAADVLEMGPDAAALWKQIPDATANLTRIAKVRETVLELVHGTPNQAQFNGWINAYRGQQIPIDYSLLYLENPTRPTGPRRPRDWLALAEQGLHLNDETETIKKVGAFGPLQYRPDFVFLPDDVKARYRRSRPMIAKARR